MYNLQKRFEGETQSMDIWTYVLSTSTQRSSSEARGILGIPHHRASTQPVPMSTKENRTFSIYLTSCPMRAIISKAQDSRTTCDLERSGCGPG